MRGALEMAGLEPQDVRVVWANAAGVSLVDEPERLAIERVFGSAAEVRTPKVSLGEPLGAGGPLNAVLALEAWRHGDPPGPAVVNSSSLGGTHISVVLAPEDWQR